jgi:hypothetical protein
MSKLETAFQKAEAGWHTVHSIMVPYLAEVGIGGHDAHLLLEKCLKLAKEKIVKVRIGFAGRYEFKLVQ